MNVRWEAIPLQRTSPDISIHFRLVHPANSSHFTVPWIEPSSSRVMFAETAVYPEWTSHICTTGLIYLTVIWLNADLQADASSGRTSTVQVCPSTAWSQTNRSAHTLDSWPSTWIPCGNEGGCADDSREAMYLPVCCGGVLILRSTIPSSFGIMRKQCNRCISSNACEYR